MADNVFRSITIIIHKTPYQDKVTKYVTNGGFENDLSGGLYFALGCNDNIDIVSSGIMELDNGDRVIEFEISESVLNNE